MKSAAHDFPARARSALNNPDLARALARARTGFVDRRLAVVETLPEFQALRRVAREIKEHTLHHLDYYLERFEARVQEHGGHVHWASTPAEARAIVIDICRAAGAQRVTKGKSMVAEEIGLNDALEAAGFEVIETDLGEYIIQLANEPPSHIIVPAIHKTKDQIADLFHAHHAKYGLTERQTEATALVGEARAVLREKFQSADVGITGANFLVAETGSSVIVTNEGNGDLTNTLPCVHIVTAAIEKVVPTLDDMSTVLRLLARSATGQETTAYTTVSSGPRRAGDLDGPDEYHVVLVDNGRSQMLGNEFREMLRCIRCGACMNHCPVYHAVGGHAYGWVYVGPMGSVLTPLIVGLDEARNLPNACTLNGRCAEVCPMEIPLADLIRKLREREFDERITPPRVRLGLRAWAFMARRPALYRLATSVGMRVLGLAGSYRGRFRWLPLAGGWTGTRDLPAPAGATFMSAWSKRRAEGRR
ncbi:MAG: LutB/LldF family L-lactate oxidation iron-sulfur protein [Gammaproteobacteria bacterium]|nr:LutB/LldF family L-lactate oxidation iron-sulfur protein [Gammaproteobacteria bacterium]